MFVEENHSPHLFLVSTPLHLLVSLAIVDHLHIANAHLLFIDQVMGVNNPYYDTLQQWSDNPFCSMAVFYRPKKSAFTKLKARKTTFSALTSVVEKLQPKHIYVGNDRRIEFQFCMHKATELGCAPIGYYLDEGVFTYVGRAASHSFADKTLDNAAKKLFYGMWWRHPPTVGASTWISVVYASYPALIHPLLKSKEVRELSLAFWQTEGLLAFCRQLVDKLAGGLDFSTIDAVVTLPHESILLADSRYKMRIQQLLQQQLDAGKTVAVKYHPRDSVPDALSVALLENVVLIPRTLPFEALLPMLKTGCRVLGNFSTTLITARLLRPDVVAQALSYGEDKHDEPLLAVYEKLGVEIVCV